jgi:hypothetical protein
MKLAADVARRSRVDGVEDLPMIGGWLKVRVGVGVDEIPLVMSMALCWIEVYFFGWCNN